MSWTRTPVSTSIRVSVARRLRNAITPTPVTNIASVESMNGAPRIAPTPTSWAASLPLPKMIAMTGIIVSGSAVPTAASTDPTAPWARFELAPEPLDAVREQLGAEQDHEERDDEDRDVHQTAIRVAATIDSATTSTTQSGDERQPPLAGREEAGAGHDDASDREGHDDHDTGPDESDRLESRQVGRDGRQVERRDRPVGQRVGARRDQPEHADEDQPDRQVGARDQDPGDQRLDGECRLARRRHVAAVGARRSCHAQRAAGHLEGRVQDAPARTASAGSGRRSGRRPASRSTPRRTPRGRSGPAMYGSISPRSR